MVSFFLRAKGKAIPEKSIVRYLGGRPVKTGPADRELLRLFKALKAQRVLVVTGRRSFERFLEQNFVEQASGKSDVLLWSAFSPNPSLDELNDLLRVAEDFRPNMIVGVGGGTALDLAKLAASFIYRPSMLQLLNSGQKPDLDYRDTSLVLVPTTAGSGAEATRFSVLYIDGIKHSVEGNAMSADVVILDEKLVLSNGKKQRASSGLDALCQAIESLWARSSNRRSASFALRGLLLLGANLQQFVNGDDSKARSVLFGSHYAGKAINLSKTTAPHALSYFLTSNYSIPHGIAVASTIGTFIDFHNHVVRNSQIINARERLGSAMAKINRALSISGPTDGASYFEGLFRSFDLRTPREYWPDSEKKRKMWVESVDAVRLSNNPVTLTTDQLMDVLSTKRDFTPENSV